MPAPCQPYLVPSAPPNAVPASAVVPQRIVPNYLDPSAALEAPTAKTGATAAKPGSGSAQPTPAEVAAWIEKHDPLFAVLNDMNKPDWASEPVQIYMRESGVGFANKDGKKPVLPPNQQEDFLDEYHCSHILVKRFVRPQRTATVYVYSFPETDQAFGAYSTMRSGATTVVVRGDASSEDDDSISFLSGRRLVLLRTTAKDDQVSKDQISALADDIVRAINDRSRKPELIANLPVLDRIAGSERLFMGPLATRKYVSVPFMQLLALEKCYAAAFAEYIFATPLTERMKVLVIEYANPQLARLTFSGYADALESARKCRSLQPNVVLCRNGDNWMLASLNGSRITLITGARHKESPVILQRQFAY